jgi:hypothetical protein
VVWDYPTVEQLARHLSEHHVNGNRSGVSASENGLD